MIIPEQYYIYHVKFVVLKCDKIIFFKGSWLMGLTDDIPSKPFTYYRRYTILLILVSEALFILYRNYRLKTWMIDSRLVQWIWRFQIKEVNALPLLLCIKYQVTFLIHFFLWIYESCPGSLFLYTWAMCVCMFVHGCDELKSIL